MRTLNWKRFCPDLIAGYETVLTILARRLDADQPGVPERNVFAVMNGIKKSDALPSREVCTILTRTNGPEQNFERLEKTML